MALGKEMCENTSCLGYGDRELVWNCSRMTKEMLRSVNKLLWCESESGSGEVEVLQQTVKEETLLRQDVYWVFWLLLFYSSHKTLLPYKKNM